MTEDVGARLLALRKWVGWSREQVARRVNDRAGLGWYQSTVQKNETGGRRLTLDDLEALVEVFGLGGIDDLLYGDTYPDVEREAEHEGQPFHWYESGDPAARTADRERSTEYLGLRSLRDWHLDRVAEIDAELARLSEPPGGWPAEDEEG